MEMFYSLVDKKSLKIPKG